MSTPDWIQDAIFYQIFPDRFANGDPANDPVNAQPWGSPPSLYGFQGGDLRGVIQRMDYLLELGVTALYLNPIFLSPSTHRYNTTDYYQIDPKLGTLEDYRALIAAAHRNGLRVILDGVFNHCGRGFFAFADVLENGEHSAYRDWFHIKRFPLDAYGHGEAHNYLGWWNHKSLPKFNTATPAVREYILRIARYWIEQGADGWRLDVPNEIDDDAFWAEFRSVVKSANREAYLLGEIWTADPRWANETHFDGLMNYPVRDALLPLLNGQGSVGQFAEKVEALFRVYARENLFAMYNPLGSHDTERLWSMLGGDLRLVKLAFLFQFAFPGAPAIYYGDEVGLEGGKDPDCRGAFPWDASAWKGDLQPWVRSLVAARKGSDALRRGEFRRLLVEDAGSYIFSRVHGDRKAICAFNFSDRERTARIPARDVPLTDGAGLRSLLDGRTAAVRDGALEIVLPPLSGACYE